MHNHAHCNSCEHTNLKYCLQCNVCYCVDCGKQFYESQPYAPCSPTIVPWTPSVPQPYWTSVGGTDGRNNIHEHRPHDTVVY